MGISTNDKTTHWQCPGCGWLTTDTAYQLARVDIQCGDCRNHKWSTFIGVHIITTGAEGRKIE